MRLSTPPSPCSNGGWVVGGENSHTNVREEKASNPLGHTAAAQQAAAALRAGGSTEGMAPTARSNGGWVVGGVREEKAADPRV